MSAAKPSSPHTARFPAEIETRAPLLPDVGLGRQPASNPAEWLLGASEGHSSAESAEQARAQGAAELGVYIHFPWCKRKCPYCDFLSLPAERAPSDAYADAVLLELRRRSAALADRTVTSIYIGGGTPSLWEPRAVARVLQAVHGQLRVASACEITVEANPSSLDLRRTRELVAVGVNRMSIGVQSLHAERLQFLGRLHDPEQAREAVATAVQANVPRLSVDVMFGLAHQGAQEAAQDAGELVDLGAEHVSAYALTLEPETAFGARASQGTLVPSDDDDIAEAYSAIQAELQRRGLEHYEISNYALPGKRARHNVGYWLGRDYLGLGCAAWGTLTFDGRTVRYRNTPSVSRYLELGSTWETADLTRAAVDLPQSELEELSPVTRLLERLMLGLRLSDGLDIAAAARALGVPPWDERGAANYQRLLRDGSLECTNGKTRIAPDRWFIANSIIAQLL